MYWVLASERSDEHELSIDSVPPLVDELGLDFGEGVAQAVPLPLIDVPCTVHPGEKLTDNVVVPAPLGLLVNSKIKAILELLDIDNIQFFPARLVDTNTGEATSGYSVANIVGTYSCVDLSASELKFCDDGAIEFIDSLVLSIGDNDDPGHIFRLAEFPPVIIISNDLKCHLERSEVTGFEIYNPAAFSL